MRVEMRRPVWKWLLYSRESCGNLDLGGRLCRLREAKKTQRSFRRFDDEFSKRSRITPGVLVQPSWWMVVAFTTTVNTKEDQIFFGFCCVFLLEKICRSKWKHLKGRQRHKISIAGIFNQCMNSHIVPKVFFKRWLIEDWTSWFSHINLDIQYIQQCHLPKGLPTLWILVLAASSQSLDVE